MSSGDYPGVEVACLEHYRKKIDDPLSTQAYLDRIEATCNLRPAPVLHFGSVFRRSELIPNMIGMPMPERRHLPCFATWADTGEVCWQLQPEDSPSRPRNRAPELVKSKKDFDDLIPQVIWRGPDYSFLSRALPDIIHPLLFDEQMIEWPLVNQTEEEMITNVIGSSGMNANQKLKKQARLERLLDPNDPEYNPTAPFVAKTRRAIKQFNKAAAVEVMKEHWDELTPRWKAVVLTAEAEVDAQPNIILPWADMKISAYTQGTVAAIERLKVSTRATKLVLPVKPSSACEPCSFRVTIYFVAYDMLFNFY